MVELSSKHDWGHIGRRCDAVLRLCIGSEGQFHCKAPISSILDATNCEDVSPGGIESRQIAGTLPQLESTLEYELLALVRWAAE